MGLFALHTYAPSSFSFFFLFSFLFFLSFFPIWKACRRADIYLCVSQAGRWHNILASVQRTMHQAVPVPCCAWAGSSQSWWPSSLFCLEVGGQATDRWRGRSFLHSFLDTLWKLWHDCFRPHLEPSRWCACESRTSPFIIEPLWQNSAEETVDV